jgi:DNA-binding response OmpR family regulator
VNVIKAKVLVVDDELGILKILGIKLKISGYDVISAMDGEQALDLMESTKPDIMLLDIIMPGMDGFQVLEKMQPTDHIPVIVLSARAENRSKAIEMGATDFVAKPFDVHNLVNKIDTVLSGSRH